MSAVRAPCVRVCLKVAALGRWGSGALQTCAESDDLALKNPVGRALLATNMLSLSERANLMWTCVFASSSKRIGGMHASTMC